jgi:hypothetical protein
MPLAYLSSGRDATFRFQALVRLRFPVCSKILNDAVN